MVDKYRTCYIFVEKKFCMLLIECCVIRAWTFFTGTCICLYVLNIFATCLRECERFPQETFDLFHILLSIEH